VNDHASEVRRYYEANTSLFERIGQAGELGTIRRAVWGPGVRSRPEAFHYVDRLIGSQLERLHSSFAPPLRVFDFGSGTGSSLIRLASWASFEGIGISLSPTQTQLANARIAARGLQAKLRCIEGDFLALPLALPAGQLVFAIEAFVHSASAGAFFRAAARQLVPGGALVICDDFLTDRAADPSRLSPRERRVLEEFRSGWVAPALASHAEVEQAANTSGFVRISTLDLTPYLELQRPRDRLVRASVALARHLPLRRAYFVRSLIGGDALQRGLLGGLIEHRFVVWRRSASPETRPSEPCARG
jgi:SAM-dependent methyltransferase